MSKNNFLFLRRITVAFAFLTLVGNPTLKGAHIVGGDMTYTCLSVDQLTNTARFEIVFRLYRDSECTNCADLEDNATIGIYLGEGNDWTHFRTRTVPLTLRNNIDPMESNPCIDVPPNIGVEFGEYRFEIDLPISNRTFKIAYQRCCRNNTINNIIDPGATGAVFSVDILPDAQRTCNSSPAFNDFPPILICSGMDVNFDHSAVDTDGDLLVYEFCTPQSAGGPQGNGGCNSPVPPPGNCLPPWDQAVFLVPNYSTIAPMGKDINGAPLVRIDGSTGLISGVPVILGQYVVGVCVKEFRNGTLIGEIRRDFQFNVVVCEERISAGVETEDPNTMTNDFVINSCNDPVITFENNSTDENFIISYDWEFVLSDSDTLKSITRNPVLEFPGIGQYHGTMILNKGLDCTDTAFVEVNIHPQPTSDFTYDYDTCVAGPIAFNDQSYVDNANIILWDWDLDSITSIDIPSPNHQYTDPGKKSITLRITDDNGCKDTLTREIEWFPVPPLLIVKPQFDKGICAPASVRIDNLSEPIDETYITSWDFGDGSPKDSSKAPIHLYPESGVYSVELEVTSPLGCVTKKFFSDLIDVRPLPEARFDIVTDNPTNFEPIVQFEDQSIDAVSWLWDFDGEGIAFDPNPAHMFQDTGQHEVQLIVTHISGCTDTIVNRVDITPQTTLFMPNAFSPNGDSDNDFFGPVGHVDGIRSYSIQVWDRWGERIFNTEDINHRWDGTVNNAGQQLPQGMYLYMVRYVEPRGQLRELAGQINLIR